MSERVQAPIPLAEAAEQRIDVLAGDRCCAGCGFNLHGQTIVREPHYKMLIVRCPECGLPAAMQEYPTLGRWTGRIRALLAAWCLVVVLGGLILTGVFTYLMTVATTQAVLEPYTSYAGSAWSQWMSKNLTPAQQSAWWSNQSSMRTWWAGLPPSAFFREFGGWSRLNWYGLMTWCYWAAALIPVGIVWSVVFPRLRGLRRGAVLLIPIAIAGFAVLDDLVGTSHGISWPFGAEPYVRQQVGWPPAFMTLAFNGACLFVGAAIGHGVARWFLALVLPARLLAAFSFLWFIDGRELPVPVGTTPRGDRKAPRTDALPLPRVPETDPPRLPSSP